MAATRYGEKRRTRKATLRGSRRGAKGVEVPEGRRPQARTCGAPRFVAVGTVPHRLAVPAADGTALSLVVNAGYEVRVGAGFDEAVLTRLVRALERL